MIPPGSEVLAVFDPDAATITDIQGFRVDNLPDCARGLACRNDSPAEYTVRIGTGAGGTGDLTRTLYAYSWFTVGIGIHRLAVTLSDSSQVAPQDGTLELVITGDVLPWAEGQLRGTTGLTLRDSHSGPYTAAETIAFDRPSGEVMLWNDDTQNDLTITWTGENAGEGPLTLKPGENAQLGVTVPGLSAAGSSAWRLEVWA